MITIFGELNQNAMGRGQAMNENQTTFIVCALTFTSVPKYLTIQLMKLRRIFFCLLSPSGICHCHFSSFVVGNYSHRHIPSNVRNVCVLGSIDGDLYGFCIDKLYVEP